jgi:hypothetical protein
MLLFCTYAMELWHVNYFGSLAVVAVTESKAPLLSLPTNP